jgi:hypothetical protein
VGSAAIGQVRQLVRQRLEGWEDTVENPSHLRRSGWRHYLIPEGTKFEY